MRLKSAALAAMILACAGPARAQYITPFNSWNFAAPAPGTVNGPPAAKPGDAPQTCVLVSRGRETPRYDCKPAPAAKPNG